MPALPNKCIALDLDFVLATPDLFGNSFINRYNNFPFLVSLASNEHLGIGFILSNCENIFLNLHLISDRVFLTIEDFQAERLNFGQLNDEIDQLESFFIIPIEGSNHEFGQIGFADKLHLLQNHIDVQVLEN